MLNISLFEHLQFVVNSFSVPFERSSSNIHKNLWKVLVQHLPVFLGNEKSSNVFATFVNVNTSSIKRYLETTNYCFCSKSKFHSYVLVYLITNIIFSMSNKQHLIAIIKFTVNYFSFFKTNRSEHPENV